MRATDKKGGHSRVATYISLAQIIIAIALMVVVILQSRTSAGLGGMFGVSLVATSSLSQK
jgi:protein translocase SecG subunit